MYTMLHMETWVLLMSIHCTGDEYRAQCIVVLQHAMKFRVTYCFLLCQDRVEWAL